MNPQAPIRWRLGVLAGIAVVLVTSIPQIKLWIDRGRDWHGSYAFTDPDELAYSAYLHSIIEGQPRRNNPYVDVSNDRIQTTAAENLFSVQFVPVYLLAFVAKSVRLSASTIFILLTPISAFLSALAVFWLITQVTANDRVAAGGALIVLLCSLLLSEYPFSSVQNYGTFAFLRRYIPAVPFPIFFLFCFLIWKAFTIKTRKALLCSVAAGMAFVFLVYSYFYLWTAAAAWLFCFGSLWAIFRRAEVAQIVKVVVVFSVIALSGLAPYFYMLSHRAQVLNQVQALSFTHVPDPFRLTEIVSAAILIVLITNVRRGAIDSKAPQLLFVLSCALAPFVVFNQQILTGRSLQSFHYEQFIINYLLMIGIVTMYHLIWNHIKIRSAFWIALALISGVATSSVISKTVGQENDICDQSIPVIATMQGEREERGSQGSVLFQQSLLAASARTSASVPVLWAPHLYTFGTTTPNENIERFFQYLYYCGVDAPSFQRMLEGQALARAAVFGLTRVNSTLSPKFQPISDDEIRTQVESYSEYVRGFSKEKAMKWPLSQIILSEGRAHDLSNVDRWYERDDGQQLESWRIYNLSLRFQADPFLDDDGAKNGAPTLHLPKR